MYLACGVTTGKPQQHTFQFANVIIPVQKHKKIMTRECLFTQVITKIIALKTSTTIKSKK